MKPSEISQSQKNANAVLVHLYKVFTNVKFIKTQSKKELQEARRGRAGGGM